MGDKKIIILLLKSFFVLFTWGMSINLRQIFGCFFGPTHLPFYPKIGRHLWTFSYTNYQTYIDMGNGQKFKLFLSFNWQKIGSSIYYL